MDGCLKTREAFRYRILNWLLCIEVLATRLTGARPHRVAAEVTNRIQLGNMGSGRLLIMSIRDNHERK